MCSHEPDSEIRIGMQPVIWEVTLGSIHRTVGQGGREGREPTTQCDTEQVTAAGVRGSVLLVTSGRVGRMFFRAVSLKSRELKVFIHQLL